MIDRNINAYLGLMCLQSTGDLHRCQHKAAGRVDHEINRHILWRVHDRTNNCLGIFQIDVPGEFLFGKRPSSDPLPICEQIERTLA